MGMQALLEPVERLAELLVMADTTDLRALADVHSSLQAIEGLARNEQELSLAGIVSAAAVLTEQIILEEVENPQKALEDLSRVAANIQAVVRDNRQIKDFLWPKGLNLAKTDVPISEEAASEDSTLTPLDSNRTSPPPEGLTAEHLHEEDVKPASPRQLEGDLSLLGEFVIEATEHLEAADINLVNLETDTENDDALNAVFRAFHTIKGVAGFLALEDVQLVAHQAENLLDLARKHKIVLAGAVMDVTFDAVDMLKRLVASVKRVLESGGVLPAVPEIPTLVARIKAAAEGKPVTSPQPSPPISAKPGENLGDTLVNAGRVTSEAIDEALSEQRAINKHKPIGELLVEQGKTIPTHVNTALEIQRENPELGKVGAILAEMGAVDPKDVHLALQQQQHLAPGPKVGELLISSGNAEAKDVAQALRSQMNLQQSAVQQLREAVKVDAARLDHLVDMIGELVIAESMVSQSMELKSIMPPELARSMAQLDKITRELQEMGTSLRMIPIRATFQKMARLVRDLARKSGKQVEFVTCGEDTELDKTVVDKIGDPLVHMVRNSVDHGIEASAEERIRAGKPAVGRVELRAFHKGGSIYVEIQDDGQGLNREAILTKALDRGLVREGEMLSDRDVWNLIFEPGLSTATAVTDVSGRGVGMDVVKRNIEALRGQVEIHSEQGRGTVFSIRLPLTLAIIDGMVVRVGKERYIIPTLSIVMSIRPELRQLTTVVKRGEMVEIQGNLVPLFRLARLFSVESAGENIQEGIVVIVEDEGHRTGLLVDEILGEQQIVIKSLGETLQGTQGIAGGAIMPDGHVGLILDVGGLVKLASGEKAGPACLET